MGNDGGDIPGRKQLVKQKKKDKIKNKKQKIQICQLSKQRLQPPLAIDRVGNIYNYIALLKSLKQSRIPLNLSHIKKFSDVKEINPSFIQSKNYQIQCPITHLQHNGINQFISIWKCGCVLSKKALQRNIKSNQTNCPNCGNNYSQEDIINMNLTPQEQKILIQKIISKRQSKQDIKKQQPQLRKINKTNQHGKQRQSNVFKSLFHKKVQQKFSFFRQSKLGIR